MAGTNALSYEVVEGWEQLPKGYAAPRRGGRGGRRGGPRLPHLPRRPSGHRLRPARASSCARGARASSPTARTASTIGPDGTRLLHRRRQPHRAQVHARGQAADDARHDGHAVGHRLRRQGHHRPSRAPAGAVQPPDQPGDRAERRPLRLRRLRQLPRPPLLPGRRAQALVGRARQRPGPVHPPHGIAVAADGRVFVCDRENDRIQIFSPDGEYLAEWTDTQRPTHLVFDPQGRAYVSELWWHEGQTSQRHGPIDRPALRPRERLRQGRQRARALGHADQRRARAASRRRTASRWTRRSDLYVGEVTWTFAVSRGLVAAGCHTFQKFALKA